MLKYNQTILSSKTISDEIGYTIWPQSSDLLEDVYLHNIKFYEGWTESFHQFGVNAAAIATFGIESPIQYLSLALSFVTGAKCVVERVSYVKHNQEPKLFSIRYLIDLLEVVIMFLLFYLGSLFLALTKNEFLPFWLGFSMVVVFFSPIIWFTLMRFTRFVLNMFLYRILTIICTLYFGLQYLFNFVSFIR